MFNGGLMCDAGRLDQLLSNLVANAGTHGSRRKSNSLATTALNGSFVLSVTNADAKTLDHIILNLFKLFERTEQKESLQGLGLDLYIANQIANAHCGKMSATSDEERTLSRLEVPLQQ
jgi:phosphoserine phosphatase RsbU/P